MAEFKVSDLAEININCTYPDIAILDKHNIIPYCMVRNYNGDTFGSHKILNNSKGNQKGFAQPK